VGDFCLRIRWQLESLLDEDDGVLNTRQKQDVTELRGTAVGLADLLDVLLDLSRLELGRMHVEKQSTDLRSFFDQILSVIRVLAEEKGIQLTVHVDQNVGAATIDPRLTRMALENLLTNAVKYTPAGGSVTFSARVQNARLHCEVADTGCGIPKEDQTQLFIKLFRASNVRDRLPGNGFGLYIAKGAIEQQDGTLQFHSQLNHGTTFIVELPLFRSPADLQAKRTDISL
jgi:signal transduction histidine kinase